MLPERCRPAHYNHPGNFLADHYGVVNQAPATPPTISPHELIEGVSPCPLSVQATDLW
jgi:hypothetical protein